MLEFFAYPVSAVMKLWHIGVSALGLNASTTWIAAIVGLVVTVRLLLLPLFWTQKRSAYSSQLMRPERNRLREQYGDSTDRADVEALLDGEKQLKEDYDYKLAAGCLPTLIQMPVILGLYRLLLWMSNPDKLQGHANAGGGVGVLSGDEVRSFMDSSLFDVPLPAYYSMTAEQFAALGTSADQVQGTILPLLCTALALTALNLTTSAFITRHSLDWSSSVARGMLKFVYLLIPIVPLLLLSAGINGPIPIALIFYWVLSNTWSLIQSIVLFVAVRRDRPETEEHREHWRTVREEFLEEKREKRNRRKNKKRFIDDARARGLSASEARSEYRQEQKRKAAEAAQEKADTKARKKEISKIKAEIRAERMKARRAQKQAGSKDQME